MSDTDNLLTEKISFHTFMTEQHITIVRTYFQKYVNQLGKISMKPTFTRPEWNQKWDDFVKWFGKVA